MWKYLRAVRQHMSHGRLNGWWQPAICSLFRWVIVIIHSGSIWRLGTSLITKVSKVPAAHATHLGNVTSLGKFMRYKCFIVNFGTGLSLFNDMSNIWQLRINRVCNLGKILRDKHSRLSHDSKYSSSMEGSCCSNKKNSRLSQLWKLKVWRWFKQANSSYGRIDCFEVTLRHRRLVNFPNPLGFVWEFEGEGKERL